MDYADYLRTRRDYWVINYHFLGFLKKITVLTLLYYLEDPAHFLYSYLTLQGLMIVLLLLLRPYITGLCSTW